MKSLIPISYRLRGLREGAIPKYSTDYTNKYIRYRYDPGHIVVTDLTNAGKRGKRVESFRLDRMDIVDRDANKSKDHNTVYQNVMKFLRGLEKLDYAKALKWAQLIIKDAKQRNVKYPQFHVEQTMGHKVLPGGFEPITFSNDSVSVGADLKSFTITDLSDPHNVPRCIDRGKSGPPKLYKWLLANLEKAKKMSYQDMMGVLDKLGIASHSYCAMD